MKTEIEAPKTPYPEPYLEAFLGEPHVLGSLDHLVNHIRQQTGDGEENGGERKGAALEHTIISPVHSVVAKEVTGEGKNTSEGGGKRGMEC